MRSTDWIDDPTIVRGAVLRGSFGNEGPRVSSRPCEPEEHEWRHSVVARTCVICGVSERKPAPRYTRAEQT